MSAPDVRNLVADLPDDGSFSVWAGPIDGEPWLTHRSAEQHYAASTMKLALVMAAFRESDAGRLDLDATTPVHGEFRSSHDGSPFTMDATEDSDPEPWRMLGDDVSLRWLAYRAIVRSSNLATNLLLDAVGTEPIGRLLTDLGCAGSRVERKIEDAAAREAGLNNIVTAGDLAAQLLALTRGRALNESSTDEVLSILLAQQLNDAIPAGVPAGTRVAHKTGSVTGVAHDVGIVYPPDAEPFVFAMCTTSALAEDDANKLIAHTAGLVWRHAEASG